MAKGFPRLGAIHTAGACCSAPPRCRAAGSFSSPNHRADPRRRVRPARGRGHRRARWRGAPRSGGTRRRGIGDPADYLAKTLRSLARDGLLTSEGGRTGRFRLSRPPERIRLIDVVRGFDDLGRDRQCLLGRGTCSDVGGCPAHAEGREGSASAFELLERPTVADLLGRRQAAVEGTPREHRPRSS
ncbi:MAG: Rrf2 family transcriptional regulator [Gemmatimonadales bacterium]|nr:MAG: Rrf2 family transcriptional regulator [Gemmatimonadales bacterium]